MASLCSFLPVKLGGLVAREERVLRARRFALMVRQTRTELAQIDVLDHGFPTSWRPAAPLGNVLANPPAPAADPIGELRASVLESTPTPPPPPIPPGPPGVCSS